MRFIKILLHLTGVNTPLFTRNLKVAPALTRPLNKEAVLNTAADTYFLDFVTFILRTDKLLFERKDRCHGWHAAVLGTDSTLWRCLASGNFWLATASQRRGLPVPPMLQLLIALQFFGAGTFWVVTGDLVNVSQPTVLCRVTNRVCGTEKQSDRKATGTEYISVSP